MGIKWSKEQEAVIASEGCDLLVSAAAGSGKTAVLVERIIRIITNEAQPVPVEKLLVLTFTNAAAAEMKERLSKGIDRCLAADPENTWLRRQKSGLHFSHISTMHSFCMELIKAHFDVLDIDPSFRVGDDSELKLLKQETAEDVLEVFYASGDENFRRFSDCYGGSKSDDGLPGMILALYEASRGQPSPEIWLNRCRRWYQTEGGAPAVQMITGYIAAEKNALVTEDIRLLQNAYDQITGLPELFAVEKVLLSDLSQVKALKACEDFPSARACLETLSWQRMPSLRKLSPESSAAKDMVMAARKTVKADISGLQSKFYERRPEDMAAELDYLRPFARTLTDLVTVFTAQYQQKKRDKNLIDFSDQEHMALQLLADIAETEDGRLKAHPTRIAIQQKAWFAHVICDEYQDTSPVQEMLLTMLSASDEGRHNRFMVGDVKQSIYRFRLADASIFMHKYDTYPSMNQAGEQPESMRIDLHRNFRSRDIVLSCTNYLFRQLMIRSFGGITYDDDAALQTGRVFPEAGELCVSSQTQLVLVDHDEEVLENNDLVLTNVELEAAAIAAKIRELTDPEHGMYVLDDETGAYRIAGYGDIVILLRTMAGMARPMAAFLMQENIPVSVEISEGFFASGEIQTMLSVLAVIDNPRQDIPLAAVLVSPMGGMRDEELAVMRAACPKGSLYDALLAAKEDPANIKCRAFYEKLADFRRVSRFMAADELLQYIYDETGYYDYVQVLPQGGKRRANLDALAMRAAAYEAGSMRGLYGFIRYIEQIKEQKMDFGEAASAAQTAGCVRLLSIHKSKGLEYPIVILAGLGKKFNMNDGKGALVIHPAFGFGMDAVNPDNRRKLPSVFKRFIAAQQRQETLAEELRILYVAMTRAKEHLVMVGTLSKPEEKLEKFSQIEGSADEPLPYGLLSGAGCFLDWVLACVFRNGAPSPLFRVSTFTPAHVLTGAAEDAAVKRLDRQALKARLESPVPDAVRAVLDRLDADASWVYPWHEAAYKKEKYSVSELKKADADSEAAPLLKETAADHAPDPEKMQRAAFRGTAFHKVMELIDFASAPEEAPPAWIAAQIDAMCAAGKLGRDQADAVFRQDVAALISGPLGRRMAAAASAGKLRREVPFMVGVPASFVDSGPGETAGDDEDLVIVQGVIDACFEENGRMVIVDYKTDAVSPEGGEQLLKVRYRRQLAYYAYALKKVLHTDSCEMRIYSTRLRRDFHV